MLTCFNLKAGTTADQFQQSVVEFTEHLKDQDLIHSSGPVGRRQRHPVMDTDTERDHEYFFIMSFRDRAQCDRAVEHVEPRAQPVESFHESVLSVVSDPVFICWEDLGREKPDDDGNAPL